MAMESMSLEGRKAFSKWRVGSGMRLAFTDFFRENGVKPCQESRN